ncbi:hypothetical protein [Streptomyces sp. NPDC046985]|uniref:hypothetical protein n=1 Tax=Streptomyces sp. NPDC046985 TaxID=3155377 RepID=UPI0033E0FD90
MGVAAVVLAAVSFGASGDRHGHQGSPAGAVRTSPAHGSPAGAGPHGSAGPPRLALLSAPNVYYLPGHITYERPLSTPEWRVDVASSASPEGPAIRPELTFDLSGLAGLVRLGEVNKQWGCVRTDLVVRCRPFAGTRWLFSPFFPLAGSRAFRGPAGTVTTTVSAPGMPAVRHVTRVVVGTPILTAREDYPELTGVRPGGPMEITPAFGNSGDVGVEAGVSVVLSAESAAFALRYRNCRYATVAHQSTAQCDFPGPLPAGAAFETDAPLLAGACADAQNGALRYSVYRLTDVPPLAAVPASAPRGAGGTLRLRPVDGRAFKARGDALRVDVASSGGVPFTTTHVHDVKAVGITVTGRVGRVVFVPVPYPKGEDWVAGGNTALRVVLPPGLTLVEHGPGWQEGDVRYCSASPSGDGSVLCPGPTEIGTELGVRIDRRVNGARGSITVTSDPATDPNQTDNTAPVTVHYLP